MSIDMSQFFQVFFEESAEHLAEIEAQLLALDIDAPDKEALNAVFRAAHSIKGSSATFGFEDLTAVTHVMESLLDSVRRGEMALSEAIVNACLQAGDVLRNLLAAHQGQAQADLAAAQAVRERLQALRAPPAPLPAGEAGYLIRFRLQCKAADHRRVLENLLAELRIHGRLVLDAPGRGGRNAEETSLRLCTTLDEASLRVLLDFVVGSSLRMEAWQGEPDALVAREAWGLFDSDAGQNGFDDPGGAFGLFALEPVQVPTDAQSVAFTADDGSFGLFEPVPEPAPVPAAGPAAQRAVSPPPDRGAAPAEPPARATGSDAGSIRVGVDKVDQMINLVGELVITQAMLAQAAARVDPVLHEDLIQTLGLLERNTRDLQESVMSVRMLPVSTVFQRFPRVVRDLSASLGKKVQLVLVGEHTELDKTLIERIADPLTHLVRNALDHGIEAPAARLAAGKVEQGTISLRAFHQSGYVVIEVADDGGGLHRERILAKARERGIPVSDTMSDQEVWMLIFEPGFSTAEVVTDVSGRGVGMDVVKKNIGALNGRIELDSVHGAGTRVTVRLPLTLAILDGMAVGSGDETYILPLDHVIESLQPDAGMVQSLAGSDCLLQVRGEYLPILSLRQLFGIPGVDPVPTQGIAVVLECDGIKAALFVEQIVGQQQVVIKSLEANYRRVRGVAGTTILGDGRVACIVDAAAVVGMAQRARAAA